MYNLNITLYVTNTLKKSNYDISGIIWIKKKAYYNNYISVILNKVSILYDINIINKLLYIIRTGWLSPLNLFYNY